MRLSRRARFNWWVVVVIAALAAPLWILIGGATVEMRIVAAVQSIFALSVMVLFLTEAPVNAIRLPWWLSLVIIWAGVSWLMFAGDTLHFFIRRETSAFSIMFVALTVVGAHPRWRKTREQERFSAWILVPVLWNPILWAIPWPQFTDPPRQSWPQICAMFALCTVWWTLRPRWRPFAIPVFVLMTALSLAFARWS